MILLDSNLLVYARVDTFPQHAAARAWLDEQLNGRTGVGLPWPSVRGFVRLVTNPRVFERPETVGQAWRQVAIWLDCGPCWVPLPTERHRDVLSELLAGHDLRATHVPDAHLAGIAIEHGLMLCSTDSDFARFSGLRWRNPIA